MIPVKLKLSNFTSYGERPPELDFTHFKLAAVSGLNGAGKSSLLDAITWCVWGTSRAGESSDALIHSGSDDMSVEFSFELDNHTYAIKRRRSKKRGGSTALELWSGNPSTGSTDSPQASSGHNLTEGTIKSTQEKIIQTLHLTFETFTNSSYLRQGHADEFTTHGPTDRKRILAEILGLDHYDALEEKARDKAKVTQTKLQLLDYQLLEIEAELSQKQEREKKLTEQQQRVDDIDSSIKASEGEIKSLQHKLESLKIASEQRDKLKQNLAETRIELEQIIDQGKQRAERIKNLELKVLELPGLEKKLLELKALQKEIDRLRTAQARVLELQKQIERTQGELNLKNHQKNVLEKDAENLLQEIKSLSSPLSRCPTCGQEIGKGQKHKVRKELEEKMHNKKEGISKILTLEEEDSLKKLTHALQTISFNEDRLTKLQHSLTQLETFRLQKELILQSQASLETERKTREELLGLFKNKKAQLDKLQSVFEKLPKMDADYQKLESELLHKESALQNLRVAEKEARTFLGQAAELISRSQQLEKLAIQKQEEKNRLQQEKTIWEELALAFGKKGIQAMIIESAIPEIETEANSLLNRLTEGRMRVHLQTQRETKTKLSDGEKGIVETLDIIISDEAGEREYSLFSGGEAFRVNFAIRLAISKLLTRRAGAKLQFLVIDEGFGSQDAPGRARLVEAIDSIKDDFEKILIITHIEQLKEEFPIRIEVSKDATGSTFEVIGV